jgi:hypothetical protein
MEPFRRAVRSRPSAAIPEGRRPSPAESEEAGLGSALAEFVATVERAGDAGSPARVESDLRLREWRVKVQQAGRRAAPSPTTKIGKPRAASPAKPVLTGKEATMREGATEPAAVPPEESSGLRRATVLGLAAAAGLVAVAAGRRYRASRIRGSG